MKVFRVALTALGYTVVAGVAGYIGAGACLWMFENLTYRQGMLVIAAVLFAWMLFPAKQFTNHGQQWPWEKR